MMKRTETDRRSTFQISDKRTYRAIYVL